MPNIYSKRVQAALYLAVIVASVTMGSVISKYYVQRHRRLAPPIPVGMTFPLANVDWEKSESTYVLALSVNCVYCRESAKYYRALTQVSAARGERVIAVLPQPIEESRQYLKDLNVPVDEVRQVELSALGVSRTPTIVLVDKTGRVKNSWVGAVPAGKEQAALALTQKEQ